MCSREHTRLGGGGGGGGGMEGQAASTRRTEFCDHMIVVPHRLAAYQLEHMSVWWKEIKSSIKTGKVARQSDMEI